MENKIKAIGYIRVSTIDQAKEGAGAEAQAIKIRNWAQLNDVELTHIYRDMGVSGSKGSRPEFNKAIKATLAAGEAGLIVCAYLSRFGRSAVNVLNKVKELDKAGARLVCVRDGIDTADMLHGRFLLTVLAAVAQLESETTRERTLDGKATKEAAGTFYDGTAPFGYIFTKKNFEFKEHAERGAIYRRVVALYLDDQMSADNIAVKMRAEGVKRIGAGSVRRMLASPVHYTGKMSRTGLSGKELTYKLPKLIPASRWQQVQARLQINKHKTKRGGADNGAFWLQNVLTCGCEECGDWLKPRTVPQHGKKYRYYSCTSKNMSTAQLALRGRKRCKMPNIPAAAIEADIWARVCVALTFNENKNELAKLAHPERWDKKATEHRLAANGYRARAAKLEQAKGRLFSMLEATEFSDKQRAEFIDKLNSYEAEVAGLEAMAEEAEAKLEEALAAKDNDKMWLDLATEAPELLAQLAEEVQTLGPEHRQKLIEGLLRGTITVEGESVPGGQPAKWYANAYIDTTKLAALERLADEGHLPALTSATRKQRRLINSMWKLAA